MTDTQKISKQKLKLSSKIYPLLWLSLLVFLLVGAESAGDDMRRGLSLCAEVLVPSLFPFMVISDILVRGGLPSLLSKPLDKPMRRVFGIGGCGAGAIALGALCGFPIGARVAVSLYDGGEITKGECERLLILSNNPSIAFAVSAVGVSLLGSRTLGVQLYTVVLISSFFTGFIFCRKKAKEPQFGAPITIPRKRLSVSDVTDAISGAALGVIKVCSFVIFFGVVLGIIGRVSGAAGGIKALLFCVFELAGGAAEAARLSRAEYALPLIAFALSWSGLSVHFQIMSICGGRNLSFARYFAAKLLQGLLSALIMAISARVLPITLERPTDLSLVSNMPSALSVILLALFCLSLLVAIAKNLKPW